MKQVARDHQRKMSSQRKGGNYTGVEVKDRWYNGKLGELCFQVLLDRKEVRYEYTETDGKPDKQDFIVYYRGKPLTIDVKTSTGGYTKYLATPIKRFQKDNHDFYVAVRLDGDIGEFVGYLRSDDMKRLDKDFFKEPNMGAHYDDCKDITLMLDGVDRI